MASQKKSGASRAYAASGQQPRVEALAGSGRYPTFARLIAHFGETGGYGLDLDALFEFGLRRLLDGLAPVVERG